MPLKSKKRRLRFPKGYYKNARSLKISVPLSAVSVRKMPATVISNRVLLGS